MEPRNLEASFEACTLVINNLLIRDLAGRSFPLTGIAEAHVSAGGVEEYYEGPAAGNSVIEDDDFNRLLEECG